MELGWTRQEATPILDVDNANHLLKGSGINAAMLEPLSQGFANHNYKLVADTGELFCLRIHRRDPETQKLESNLMNMFNGRIPLPQLVFENLEHGVSLLAWLSGDTFQTLQANGREREALSTAEELGRILAEISSVKFGTAGFLDADLNLKEAWPAMVDGYRNYLHSLLDSTRIRERLSKEPIRLIKLVWRGFNEEMRQATSQPCLAHGDFKPSNILIHEGRVTGILDWEFSHSGTWLSDAGQILRYLGPNRYQFAKDFEQGLRDGGITPPLRWEFLARTIDLVNLVALLERDTAGEQQISDLRMLIQSTLDS